GGCDPLVTCTNDRAGRRCGACPAGYSGTGDTACVDIDECMVDNGDCPTGTTCKNRPGTFICACNAGTSGSPTDCRALPRLAAGNYHTCLRTAEGAARCWGANDRGQSTALPGPVLQVTAGVDFTCALRADKTVACW